MECRPSPGSHLRNPACLDSIEACPRSETHAFPVSYSELKHTIDFSLPTWPMSESYQLVFACQIQKCMGSTVLRVHSYRHAPVKETFGPDLHPALAGVSPETHE